MKIQECMLLLSLGLIIWILGTIYYAYAGHHVLDTTPARYWVSFAISPIFSAAFCILILRWRHIAPSNWAVAMLLLAIPGMVGEAVVLSNLGTFMPRIQETSDGRYGAFSSPPTPSFSESPNSPRFAPHVRRGQRVKHWKPRHKVSSWRWASRSPYSGQVVGNPYLTGLWKGASPGQGAIYLGLNSISRA
jgi:Family of unknown function (DUF5367)